MPRITSLTPEPRSALSAMEAEHVFDRIAQFAHYGFNKSHAAAYAAISYHTAYLRTHHPEAFFAAAMNLCLDDVEAIAAHADDLRRRGLVLEKPAINRAGTAFAPDPEAAGQLRYGLAALRGVGRKDAAAIVAERDRAGPFGSIEGAMVRLRGVVGRGALKALAKAGAFDCLGAKRAEALAHAASATPAAGGGQGSLFDMMDDAPTKITVDPLTRTQALDLEFDVLGHYHSAHPLGAASCPLAQLRAAHLDGPRDIRVEAIVTASDTLRTNDGDTIGLLTVSTPGGLTQLRAGDRLWPRIARLCTKKARLVLTLRALPDAGSVRLLLNDAAPVAAPAEAVTAA